MEVYESHLGGIYFSESIIDDEYLYCEQCGDNDWHLGRADTWQDVLDMITEDDGWCPYSEEMVADWKGKFEAWIEMT
jgi:hypothetical protein